MIKEIPVREPVDKLPGFNVLRFFLAVWVALIHYKQLPDALGINYEFSSLPNFKVLSWFYLHMVDPVPIFWSVSGFVFFVAYPEYREFDTKRFMIARFARLFPLHWTTLITMVCVSAIQSVCFSIVNVNETLPVFLAHLFLVQNWFVYLSDAFNGPSWSISVELMTYVVYGVFKIHSNRFVFFIVIAISAILFIVTKPSSHLSPFLSIFLFFFSHLIASFSIERTWKMNIFVFSVLTVITVTLMVFLPNYSVLFRAPLVAFSVILIFKCVRKLPDPGLLGNITYSIYLWHVPIMSLIVIAIKLLKIEPTVTLTVAFQNSYFISLCFIAGLSFRFLEKPLRNKINNIKSYSFMHNSMHK